MLSPNAGKVEKLILNLDLDPDQSQNVSDCSIVGIFSVSFGSKN